jgi:hypothetical protein
MIIMETDVAYCREESTGRYLRVCPDITHV